MRGMLFLPIALLASGAVAAPQAAKPATSQAAEHQSPFPDLPEPDVEPGWRKKPSAQDLQVVWPVKAYEQGRGGKAVIACKVSLQGALFDCRVLDETPAGEGFGQAAIALTPQMLMKPGYKNGKPVVSGVRIPVTFSMPGGGGLSGPMEGKGMARPTMAWVQAPSAADVAAAYPPKARAANVGGFASLACSLTRNGRLRSCDVMTEEPRGMGFGSAARELSKLFQAPNVTTDGKSVSGIGVHLPVTFAPEMLTNAKPVVGQPVWAALPDNEAFGKAFGSLPAGVGSVQVTLACKVQQGGTVSGCVVARESPAGLGIGERALPLAEGVKLGTWSNEGLPVVGGTVRIPFRYQLKEAAQAAEKPAGG